MLISRTVAAWLTAGAIALAASAAPSFAQGRGQGQGQGRGGGQSSPPKAGKPATPKTQPTTPKTQAPGQMKTPVAVHPPLARNLQPLLPGIDVNVASQGFRNLGQFVAAVHVSNNLGIPFTELKTSMVTQGRSLGQSIQELRPNANASAEAARAERQARATMGKNGK